jgi:TonB family protein
MAQQLAERLHAKKKTTVSVAIFKGPDRSFTQAGKSMSEQFYQSLKSADQSLKFVDFEQIKTMASDHHLLTVDAYDWEVSRDLAAVAHADVQIRGSFRIIANGIELKISWVPTEGQAEDYAKDPAPRELGHLIATPPVSMEMQSQSNEPLLEAHGEFLDLSIPGIKYPMCSECPPPEFSREASAAKVTKATVVLRVTVLPDGNLTEIAVIESPGYGLDQVAWKAVKSWKLKPALDAKGKPVSVRMSVEVLFRRF